MKKETLQKLSGFVLAGSALLLFLLGFFASLLIFRESVKNALTRLVPTLAFAIFFVLYEKHHIFPSPCRHTRVTVLVIGLFGMAALCLDFGKGLLLPLLYLFAGSVCLNAHTNKSRPWITMLALSAAAWFAAAFVNSFAVFVMLLVLSFWIFFRVWKKQSAPVNYMSVVLLIELPIFSITFNNKIYSAFSAFDDVLTSFMTTNLWGEDAAATTRKVWAGTAEITQISPELLRNRIPMMIANAWGQFAGIACIVLMVVFCLALLCRWLTAERGLQRDLAGFSFVVFTLAYAVYILLSCGAFQYFCLEDAVPPLLGTDPFINIAALSIVVLLTVADPLSGEERIDRFDSLFPNAEAQEIFQIKTVPLYPENGDPFDLVYLLSNTFSSNENTMTLLSDPHGLWINTFADYETVTLIRYEGSPDGALELHKVFACHTAMAVKVIAHPDVSMVDLFDICQQLLPDEERPIDCFAEYDGRLEEDTVRLYIAVLSDSYLDLLPESNAEDAKS